VSQVTIGGETYFSFEIINHTHRDTYAVDSKEELVDWIEKFNKMIDDQK
jgi:hypothetical protein